MVVIYEDSPVVAEDAPIGPPLAAWCTECRRWFSAWDLRLGDTACVLCGAR